MTLVNSSQIAYLLWLAHAYLISFESFVSIPLTLYNKELTKVISKPKVTSHVTDVKLNFLFIFEMPFPYSYLWFYSFCL